MQGSSKIFTDLGKILKQSLWRCLKDFYKGDYNWSTYTLTWLTGMGLGVVQKLSLGLKKREKMIMHKPAIFKWYFVPGKCAI